MTLARKAIHTPGCAGRGQGAHLARSGGYTSVELLIGLSSPSCSPTVPAVEDGLDVPADRGPMYSQLPGQPRLDSVVEKRPTVVDNESDELVLPEPSIELPHRVVLRRGSAARRGRSAPRCFGGLAFAHYFKPPGVFVAKGALAHAHLTVEQVVEARRADVAEAPALTDEHKRSIYGLMGGMVVVGENVGGAPLRVGASVVVVMVGPV